MALRLDAESVSLPFAETFTNFRGSRDEERVVRVTVEHDGVVGEGEAAPVTYRGESQEGMLAFLTEEAPKALGREPTAIEPIGRRLRELGGSSGARCAVEGALHDWLGKRYGEPTWRLLGLSPSAPRSSYTVSVDSVANTRERLQRADGFEVVKLKVGGADDLACIEAVRRETDRALRIDANEGWTLEHARELMPALVELSVEFLEQPFPVDDLQSYRALRELGERVPVVLDESCQDLSTVAALADHADGISVKLEKAGGLRESLRVIAAARALGLGVMLSCMLQSQLGIAHAVQIASLADWADLDGHFLVAESDHHGLGFVDGRVLPSSAPGLGVSRS